MGEHTQELKHTPEISNDIPMNDGEKVTPPIGLVSVGVAVRNGGQMLSYALDSIIYQDYKNLEIIISDNDSTDDTALIALEYQKRDSRIIYHRQPKFLTALENFRFVLDEARGEYFMWAAHDDTRSLNYVSVLLSAMQSDPELIINFGDLYYTPSIKSAGRHITDYDFDNTNLRPLQRMRKAAHKSCAHFYGLWRADVLRTVHFYPCTWCPDVPIMVAAAYLGRFKYVQGTGITCYAVPKNESERATYNDGSTDFNKYKSMLYLILATYKTSAAVGGILIGMAAALFVTENHVRNLPGFIFRKLNKIVTKVNGVEKGDS